MSQGNSDICMGTGSSLHNGTVVVISFLSLSVYLHHASSHLPVGRALTHITNKRVPSSSWTGNDSRTTAQRKTNRYIKWWTSCLSNGIHTFTSFQFKCSAWSQCVLVFVDVPPGCSLLRTVQRMSRGRGGSGAWVVWLSVDGDETGQLYSSRAFCSIRLDLNIALENWSCLIIHTWLSGAPAQT